MAVIHSVLVTGAWRGIGLEFIKQFLTNPLVETEIVIATCLIPNEANELLELQKSHPNLHILELDVTNFGSFDTLASEVGNLVGDKGLTLLVNNAGIGSPIRSLEILNADEYISILKTNTVGPVVLTKALLPLLKKSAAANAASNNNKLGITRSAVISVSSCFGSIQLTGSDKELAFVRAYGYRESKAALNMATQLMSMELEADGILVESLHPGFVITDMTAKIQAKITTETSVTGMLQVMLKMEGKNKNGFSAFDGQVLPF